MKKILKLAFSYIRYYKNRRWLCFLVWYFPQQSSQASVPSFTAEGRQLWKMPGRNTGTGITRSGVQNPGLKIFKKSGRKGISDRNIWHKDHKKTAEEPFEMEFVSADSSYLKMMGRKLLEGKMPEVSSEIAMNAMLSEIWISRRNLDVP